MSAQVRTRWRLALRDLGAIAAFGAMAISGELPAWAVVLFAVTAVLALLDVRPLVKFPIASGIAVAASAALLYAQVAFGGLDLVVAACTFAALITAHRLLSAPGGRTDHQVLLTSLLMISGGAALLGDLLFAVMLGVFAVCACLSLCLGVLEAAAPAAAPLPVRPALKRIGVGVAVAFVGAILFFVLMPRLSWNIAGRRMSRGLGAATGLTDGVRLDAPAGTIKTNPRVVARIVLEPDPGTPRLDAYWLASTFGEWTGTQWRDDAKARRARGRVTLRPGTDRLIHQRIELLPAYGIQVAIALVEPVLLGHATAHRGGSRARIPMIEYEGKEVRFAEAADGYSYHAYSAPDGALMAPEISEETLERLRRLPEGVDPRIARLAARVTGGTRDPLEAARRIERHLKRDYRYTLELPGRTADPLAHFLFERKAGHCEYFASALAVMLRTQGFAARVATGFYGGERSGAEYVLRAGDAHAWTQVWVPGRGFVNVDATPEAGRAAQTWAVLEWLMRQYERVDAWWRGSVLEYSLRDQSRMAFRLLAATPKQRETMKVPPRTAWMVAALLGLGVYVLYRIGVARRARTKLRTETAMRARAEAVLGSIGVSARPGEGIEELSARLWAERHPLAPPFRTLTRRYVEARFGHAPLGPDEAASLLAALEAGAERLKRHRAA